MGSMRGIVGFDRSIRLNWLDRTAEWASQGRSTADIRMRLNRLLDGQVAGEGPHSARGKTMTVLIHIWVQVPDPAVPLRNEGLTLLSNSREHDRLPLHWGMCLATYPFFRDVAATTGRLLSLQGTATLAQVTRRIVEKWGARSTVTRASRRVVRSMVDWEVLRDTGRRGVFRGSRAQPVSNGNGVGVWLVEAGLLGSGREAVPLGAVTRHPMLFPFRLAVGAREAAASSRLELYREGAGGDVVTLRGA